MFAVVMVAMVKADCQSFVAVDIVVIAAAVVAVYSFCTCFTCTWKFLTAPTSFTM